MSPRKILLPFFCCLPLICVADDVETAQTHLGTIEAWRVTPEAVLRYCKRIDPDGDSKRQEKFNAWSHEHAVFISQIDARFGELLPQYYSPPSGDLPVESAKAQIIVHQLRQQFSRKNDEESVSYCRKYTQNDFPLWSKEMLGYAQSALHALDQLLATKK